LWCYYTFFELGSADLSSFLLTVLHITTNSQKRDTWKSNSVKCAYNQWNNSRPNQFFPKKLKIFITATGTRGDVQPYVALGKFIQRYKNGFQRVVILTQSKYQSMVEEAGLGFCPCDSIHIDVEVSSAAWTESTCLSEFISRTSQERETQFESECTALHLLIRKTCGKPPKASFPRLPNTVNPEYQCKERVVLISSQFTSDAVEFCADRWNLPHWSIHLMLSRPTKCFPPLMGEYPQSILQNGSPPIDFRTDGDRDDWEGTLNVLAWARTLIGIVMSYKMNTNLGPLKDRLTKEYGASKNETPLFLGYIPTLFAVGKSLVPTPKYPAGGSLARTCKVPDWPSWCSIVGFLWNAENVAYEKERGLHELEDIKANGEIWTKQDEERMATRVSAVRVNYPLFDEKDTANEEGKRMEKDTSYGMKKKLLMMAKSMNLGKAEFKELVLTRAKRNQGKYSWPPRGPKFCLHNDEKDKSYKSCFWHQCPEIWSDLHNDPMPKTITDAKKLKPKECSRKERIGRHGLMKNVDLVDLILKSKPGTSTNEKSVERKIKDDKKELSKEAKTSKLKKKKLEKRKVMPDVYKTMDPQLGRFLYEHSGYDPRIGKVDKKKKRPVVCITFSSMPITTSFIVNMLHALKELELPCVFLYGGGKNKGHFLRARSEVYGGYGELSRKSKLLLGLAGYDHDLLFPHMACVVHHGGAGTCAKVMKYGVPAIIVPILKWTDQAGWAELARSRAGAIHLDKEEIEIPRRKDCTLKLNPFNGSEEKVEEAKKDKDPLPFPEDLINAFVEFLEPQYDPAGGVGYFADAVKKALSPHGEERKAAKEMGEKLRKEVGGCERTCQHLFEECLCGKIYMEKESYRGITFWQKLWYYFATLGTYMHEINSSKYQRSLKKIEDWDYINTMRNCIRCRYCTKLDSFHDGHK